MHDLFWNKDDSFRNIVRTAYWKEGRPKVNYEQPQGLAEVLMLIDMLGRRAILYLYKRVLNRTGVSGQRHFIGIPVSEVHLPHMNFLYS